MIQTTLPLARVRQILARAAKTRILVVGDVMLDHFIWGNVNRISPEAPVPVLEFQRESFVPGGAANVARNLAALTAHPHLFGVLGRDFPGRQLRKLLEDHQVACTGLLANGARQTSVKTRVIAHRQQVVRVDRETRDGLNGPLARQLVLKLQSALSGAAAVVVGDYGKGTITQSILESIKRICYARAVWLSLDPKPIHHLNLAGLSLITPNRKESFELADLPDHTWNCNPLEDVNLMRVAAKLLADFRPAVLLITLGELGMLLCQHGQSTVHIPTVAREVFDVSGAGDTVIAAFTLAIAAGASPLEAAIFSNHAAGIVVAKVGTATVSPEELLESFKH
jgi:D-glycero-beta-D-manno-heptose-7-phosphate kinase